MPNGNGKVFTMDDAFNMVINITNDIQVTRQRLITAQNECQLIDKNLQALESRRDSLLMDLVSARGDTQMKKLQQDLAESKKSKSDQKIKK